MLSRPIIISTIRNKNFKSAAKACHPADYSARGLLSMPEMSDAGEDHSQAVLIAGLDRVLIAHGTAGLDDGSDSRLGRLIDVVAKRKESVGSHHAANRSIASLPNR
jgi:hypothetical protein